MMIKWVTTKAQQFLPVKDAGVDEFSANFDFVLSVEMMALLSAQHDRHRQQGAVAGTHQQAEIADAPAISQLALDEHELALA